MNVICFNSLENADKNKNNFSKHYLNQQDKNTPLKVLNCIYPRFLLDVYYQTAVLEKKALK